MRTAILSLLISICLCSGCATTKNSTPVAPVNAKIDERPSPKNVQEKKDERPRPESPDPKAIDNPMVIISLADKTVLPLTSSNDLYINFRAGKDLLSGNKGIKLSLLAGLPKTVSSDADERNLGVTVGFGPDEDVMVSGSVGSFTIAKKTLSSFVFLAGFGGSIAVGSVAAEPKLKGMGTLKLALYDLDYSFSPRVMGKQISNCLQIPFKIDAK